MSLRKRKILVVYVNDKCNLRCDYCYVHKSGGGQALSCRELMRAVDIYLDGEFHHDGIAFLGGEPFLDIQNISKTVKYVRETRGRDFELLLFTNGTRLTRKALDFFDKYRVRLNISLDGRKEINDSNRKFPAGGRSVFDAVHGRIKASGIKDFGNIQANPVFSTSTAGSLLESIKFLNGIGFKNILFDQQLWEKWDSAGLRALDLFFQELPGYLSKNQGRVDIPLLDEVMEKHPLTRAGRGAWWASCDKIVLGPDGNFYVCEYALSVPRSKSGDFIIGSLSKGLDQKRASGLLSGARNAVYRAIRAGKDRGYFWFCPMGMYFEYTAKGTPGVASDLRSYNAFSRFFMNRLIWARSELARLSSSARPR